MFVCLCVCTHTLTNRVRCVCCSCSRASEAIFFGERVADGLTMYMIGWMSQEEEEEEKWDGRWGGV